MHPNKLIEVVSAGTSRSRKVLQPLHLVAQPHTQLARNVGTEAGSTRSKTLHRQRSLHLATMHLLLSHKAIYTQTTMVLHLDISAAL